MTLKLLAILGLGLSSSLTLAQNIKPQDDTEAKTYEQLRQQENLKKRFPLDIRLTISALNGNPVSQVDKPIITFIKSGQRISGFGGCNSMGGDFRLTPRQMRFGPLSFTTNACLDEAKKLELAIFKAIQFATHWTPAGHNSITLHGKAGTVTFKPAF